MGNDVAAIADRSPAFRIMIRTVIGHGHRRRHERCATAADRRGLGVAGQCDVAKRAARRFLEEEDEQPETISTPLRRGSNGYCSPTYLCIDGTHEYKDYGGPTGWGTPNGIGAF